MRVPVLCVSVLACLASWACGQKLDHPGTVPACDPAVMHCQFTPPNGAEMGGGNEGGADTGAAAVATFSGEVLAFSDDYFDQGGLFSGEAQVSATGRSGARVTARYDGTSFQLVDVLKTPGNWFLTNPVSGTGSLATLLPVDTRSAKADMLTVGVADAAVIDAIFLAASGTDRALDRAQIVLTVADEKLRSVTGVTATLGAEVTAYRAAGAWVGVTTQNATDDSGMIFFGNVPAGSALSQVTISLTGTVTARVDVSVAAGAVSILTAIVSP